MASIVQEVEALVRQWKGFYDKAAKPGNCQFCGGTRIWWNGWRRRTASVLVGDQVVYVDEVACRLVKCGHAGCRKSWTLRPPGLLPQRHYQLCVVAAALSTYLFDPEASLEQVAGSIGCARRTIGRWITWVAGIALPGELLRHLVEASGVTQLPCLPEVAALARKAQGAVQHSLLQRSAQVLGLCETLGQALGMSPPGLRGVVEAVVGNRYRATTLHRPRLLEFARRQPGLVAGTLPM